jgi:hypothetical protein
MEWNGMEWNGMEWNGMEWNGMEWNANIHAINIKLNMLCLCYIGCMTRSFV